MAVCIDCGVAVAGRNKRCEICKKEIARQRAVAFREANPSYAADSARARRAAEPEKHRQQAAKYREANREHVNALARGHCTRYREVWVERQRKRRAEKPEETKRLNAQRYARHPEANKMGSFRRRSRKSTGRLSKGLTAALFAKQNGKCACCGVDLGEKYELDHIMPLALGGTNTDDNMQLLTQRCNRQKNAMHPEVFMKRRRQTHEQVTQ